MPQLVWHLQFVDTTLDGSELDCCNKEDDRNSVASQASCRMDAAAVNHEMLKFTHAWQRTMDALGDYSEGV